MSFPSSDLGDLILILGDAHIPHRRDDFPQQFRELFQIFTSGQAKLAHILVTGNSGSAAITNYFKSLALSTVFARGDQDLTSEGAKEIKEIVQMKISKEISVGMMHGHTICPWGDIRKLEAVQRELDCDILIHGHTHQMSVGVTEEFNRLLINPGSCTGAYSSFSTDVIPSFVLLSVKGSAVQIFVYQLINNEVKVTKSEYNKTKKS